MKHVFPFFSLFALTTCTMIMACGKKKNSCDGLCDLPAFGTYLAFTVKAKTSGQDYFFSSPPLYPSSALKITNLHHDTLAFRIFVDTFSTVHNFRVWGTKAGNNTMLLAIDGLQPDTLRYTAAFYSFSCCGVGAIMTDVYLNSQLVTQTFDTDNGGKSPKPILTLYKN